MKRREVVTVVEGLLECLEPVNWDEVPDSCGACGTPAAMCDTNCVDRANAAIYDAKYKSGVALIANIKALPKPLAKGRVLSDEGMDRLLMGMTACPECQDEFDQAPACRSILHQQMYEFLTR